MHVISVAGLGYTRTIHMYFDPQEEEAPPPRPPKPPGGLPHNLAITVPYMSCAVLPCHGLCASFLHSLPPSSTPFLPPSPLPVSPPYRVQQSCALQERRAVFVPAPLPGSGACKAELLETGHAVSHTVHGPSSS